MTRSAPAALLVLLALAAPASAAAPWTAAQDLSGPHTFVSPPALALSGNATALASWTWQDGIGPGSRAGAQAAVRAPGAAGFSPPYASDAAPLLYGATRVLAAVSGPVSAAAAERRSRIAVRFGRVGRALGPPRTIAVRSDVRQLRLAGDAAGDAALAWWEGGQGRSARVVVSLRPRGSSFGAPIRLAAGPIRSISAAVSPRGDVLVAWDARGVVRARIRAHGHWGRTDTIRSHPTYDADLRSALSAGGRAIVAWGAQLLTEGGDRGPVYYEAAARPAGAARFRAAQLLERQSDAQRRAGLDLAVGGSGRATLAWTGWDGAHYRVRVADTAGAVTFGAPQAVSAPGEDAFEGALATAPDGRRLVAWTVPAPPFELESGGRALAAVAAESGPFGGPEEVANGPEARIGAAAYDPRADRWTLVWSNRPAGSGNPIGLPLAQIRTFAQSASRPAG